MPTQTDQQRQAAFNAAGLSQDQQNAVASGVASGTPVTPPTVSSASLTPTTSPVIPPPATPKDYSAQAASSIDSLLANYNATLPQEATGSDLQQRILDSLTKLGTQSTRQQELQNQAGLPEQQKQLQDVVNQLQGLQKEAAAIPLQIQQEFTGRGATAAGVDPIETGRLRENTIKSLGLAAIGQTLQGNISLAETNIKNALEAEFAPEKAKLDTLQKLYTFNKDALERADKKRSDALQIQLQERSRILDQQQKDKEAASALALAAVKNFAQDPQAQRAAQQVLSMDVNSPTYLSDVFKLVGKYQQDPTAVQEALDKHQLAQANIAEAYANAAKINAERKALTSSVPTGGGDLVNAFNSAATGLSAAQMKQAQATFNQLVSQNDIQGAKDYIVRVAMTSAPTDQQNQTIGRSQAIDALQQIQGLIDEAKAKGTNTNLLSGNLTKVAEKLGTTNDPDLSYISGRILAVLQVYRRAMTGVAFSPQESAQYEQLFPGVTKTGDLNTTKIAALTDALNANNSTVLSFYLGKTNYDRLFKAESPGLPSNRNTNSSVLWGPDGKQYNVPNEQVDAFLKAGGHK